MLQHQQVFDCISGFSGKTIRKLTRTNERRVLKEILKRFSDCVVLFTNEEETESHITRPKYEPKSRYIFVILRYVIGKYEKLRTASERLCLTYALDTDTSTELKAKHDDAFNVEAVTKRFYEDYKTGLSLTEKERLEKLMKTLGSCDSKKKFFWEIDFAAVGEGEVFEKGGIKWSN